MSSNKNSAGIPFRNLKVTDAAQIPRDYRYAVLLCLFTLKRHFFVGQFWL